MNTVSEYIRKRLLEGVGVYDNLKTDLTPAQILDSQMNWEFLSEMAHRMIMGFFRYGPFEKQTETYSYIEEAKKKIALYIKTKNLECLCDAANYLMLERNKPSIKNTYFASSDDKNHAVPKGGA